MLPEHKLIASIDKNISKRVDVLVNRNKIEKYLGSVNIFSEHEYQEITKVIGIYELAIVDLWNYNFETSKENLEKRKTVNSLCKKCFDLLQTLPIPEEPLLKIKHVLKLFTYSYLGEKWEDMRRILNEETAIWNINRENDYWDVRLFCTIYLSLLYLVRKESWQDLNTSIEYITTLRIEQKKFEKTYLDSKKDEDKKGTILELASLYHLAKAVDMMAQYMLKGIPTNILPPLEYHLDTSIEYSQSARIIELDILLIMLKATFRKMISNSIWNVASRINSRVTKFIKSLTEVDAVHKPIFELLYPQRVAILEQGLLDPASKAIVINLPTSSGKTIIAEFRILQALNQFYDTNGKIVYVVPTRALVNQITSRLRRDLGGNHLNIKVEKMSGAIEVDSFEENILETSSFDILVTTPEKLNLLIRNPNNVNFTKKIVLSIIDEAHNLSDKNRGLNLEMLISNIQKDCELSNLLLMTPFIPNYHEVAKWLDPFNPRSISMELEWWQPNDKVVGIYFAEGNRNESNTFFRPLMTYSSTLTLNKKIKIGKYINKKYSLSKINSSKSNLTSLLATQIYDKQRILILAYNVESSWNIAKKIFDILPKETIYNENIDLVCRYISAELGENFPLVKYLTKGIGVHNAGLPDDIRELMEWLMEIGSLNVLISTTTIAQGMNFPVNGILLTSYSHPLSGPMPSIEFWNLVGRTGRIDHRSLGIVGIAVTKGEETKKAAEYVMKKTDELISVLKQMVEDATKLGNQLDLVALASEPEWSSFLQYISHMYKQSENLQKFIAEVNITLRRTYGFNQLTQKKKDALMDAVKDYAKKLDKNQSFATLSDMTGFSPETIEKTISKVHNLNITPSEWTSSRLFSNESKILAKLTGLMINDIPEIRKELSDIKIKGTKITNETLSLLIVDWVSGKQIKDIALTYFGGSDTDSITKCVKAIYSKVANSATWGLAAIQKMPTSNTGLDKLTEDEKKKLVNMPAMIYYGVNSDEAILMRLNNIPRSISTKMGKLFKSENDLYKSKSTEVIEWLKKLDDTKWNNIVPKNKNLSGQEYKKIWKRLAGIEN